MLIGLVVAGVLHDAGIVSGGIVVDIDVLATIAIDNGVIARETRTAARNTTGSDFEQARGVATEGRAETTGERAEVAMTPGIVNGGGAAETDVTPIGRHCGRGATEIEERHGIAAITVVGVPDLLIAGL